MFKLEVEHHEHFTEINIGGQLAAVVRHGTLEERRAVSNEKWYEIATVASPFD